MNEEEFVEYAEKENNRSRKEMIENSKRVKELYEKFRRAL